MIARALLLATEEVPTLRALQVCGDGRLEKISEPSAKIDSRAMAEGSVIVIAHLLGLLTAFIGEELTVEIVDEVWPPQLTPPKREPAATGKHEEENRREF